MFTFSALRLEIPFWSNLIEKFKAARFRQSFLILNYCLTHFSPVFPPGNVRKRNFPKSIKFLVTLFDFFIASSYFCKLVKTPENASDLQSFLSVTTNTE